MNRNLPPDLVELIFSRLGARYGRDFFGQYEGVEPTLLKAEWAHTLAGFDTRPEAIDYALDNLPLAKPPNSGQFRALCNAAPAPKPKPDELPPPKPNPRRIRATLDELARTRESLSADRLQWAYDMKARADAGHVFPDAERKAYEEVLAGTIRPSEKGLFAGVTLPPVETWPPNMRAELRPDWRPEPPDHEDAP